MAGKRRGDNFVRNVAPVSDGARPARRRCCHNGPGRQMARKLTRAFVILSKPRLSRLLLYSRHLAIIAVTHVYKRTIRNVPENQTPVWPFCFYSSPFCCYSSPSRGLPSRFQFNSINRASFWLFVLIRGNCLASVNINITNATRFTCMYKWKPFADHVICDLHKMRIKDVMWPLLRQLHFLRPDSFYLCVSILKKD